MNSTKTTRPKSKRSCFGCVGGCFLVALVMVIGFSSLIWYSFQSTQTIPEFYARALESTPEVAKEQGDHFERKMVQIQSAANSAQPWKIELTDDQFNGWISSDLPEKFPGSLPASVSDPRISFSKNQIQIAFKFQTQGFETVVVAKGDIFCTESQNEVAIEIESVQSGIFSVPIDRWLEKCSRVLEKNGFTILWTTDDGHSVGLLTIPDHVATVDNGRFLVLESIMLGEGTLTLAGISTNPDQTFADDSSEDEQDATSK